MKAAPAAESRVELAERIDRIASQARSVACGQAQLLVEITDFTDARRFADRAAGSPVESAGSRAVAEVALALRVTAATVEHQAILGRALRDDFAQLLAACMVGDVTLAAARVVVEETAVLEPLQRRALDADVTADALCMTPSRLRRATRRRVLRADADAAVKREALARAKRSVHAVMHADGVGTLSALLSAEETVRCWQALDSYARGVRADGDPRSIAALMVDTFVERLTGATKSAPPAMSVSVVISAAALFGETTDPATLDGYGAISPELARHLIHQAAATGTVSLRRLVCDPFDGSLIHADTGRRLVDGELRAFLTAADVQGCRMPGCEAPFRHADHLQAWVDNGPTSGANTHGLCVGSHVTRHHRGWRLSEQPHPRGGRPTVVWHTPTGHTYSSPPPAVLGPGSIRHRRPARHRVPRVDIRWPAPADRRIELHLRR